MLFENFNIVRQLIGLVAMALVVVAIVVVSFVVVPIAWKWLTISSEQITVPVQSSAGSTATFERELKLVTLLDFDSIPAILDPEFVTPSEAEKWMDADEQVLGLSINGEHRAYAIGPTREGC